MNILIIEREELLALNLCRYFEAIKHIQTQYVTTFEDAAKLLSQQKFDLVISDFCLPDCENEGKLFEIDNLNPGQKLIIISSYQMPKNLSLSSKLNIIGYFEKPFDVKIIANLVKQLNN